jgi:hypothetical protein
MSNPFTRGSAPGRARDASQRPGSFKPGHKKLGGRKKGTPNRISAEHKRAVMAVADRVGMDGMGDGGLVGYLCYLARQYPGAFCKALCRIMDLQEASPKRFSHTAYQLDADFRQPILTDNHEPEDARIDELIVMAMREPEAFSAALTALLPRPSKRRLSRGNRLTRDGR